MKVVQIRYRQTPNSTVNTLKLVPHCSKSVLYGNVIRVAKGTQIQLNPYCPALKLYCVWFAWIWIRDHPFKTSSNFHDFWPLPPSRRQPSAFQQNAPPPSKKDVGIWQFCPPPLLTKYPLDTIFTDQTKGVFVGVVKYNQKFTIVN